MYVLRKVALRLMHCDVKVLCICEWHASSGSCCLNTAEIYDSVEEDLFAWNKIPHILLRHKARSVQLAADTVLCVHIYDYTVVSCVMYA